MVPRIGQRGKSFKGITSYLLNPRKGTQKERVRYTYTKNLISNDIAKASQMMIYTAKRAEQTKMENGLSPAGRKAKKPVFHFSLSWHLEDEPTKELMIDSCSEMIDVLGLTEHEWYMITHDEREHIHSHVVASLVHPETGLMANPRYEHLKASKWALEYEQKMGEIRCPERAQNWEKRKELTPEGKEQFVKHKEQPLFDKQSIWQLYQNSDSTKAFQAALEAQGMTLAQGDRRGAVIIDQKGRVSSLARHLEGQRAKDIRERLDLKSLPNIEEVNYRQEQQRAKDRIAQEQKLKELKAKENKSVIENQMDATPQKSIETTGKRRKAPQYKPEKPRVPFEYKSFAEELDRVREKEQQKQRALDKKRIELEEFYRIKERQNQQQNLKDKASKSMFNAKSLLEQIELNKKGLENADMRIKEQGIQMSELEKPHESMPSPDQPKQSLFERFNLEVERVAQNTEKDVQGNQNIERSEPFEDNKDRDFHETDPIEPEGP